MSHVTWFLASLRQVKGRSTADKPGQVAIVAPFKRPPAPAYARWESLKRSKQGNELLTLARRRGNYVASGIIALAPTGAGQYARVQVRPAHAAGLICRHTLHMGHIHVLP